MTNLKGKISASMMCASLDKIFYYLEKFKEADLEFLHLDIMDGEFVPNIGFGTDYVRSLREVTDISFDYHFMVNNPLEKMKWFDIRECDQVAIHYENNFNIKECLDYLDKCGAKKLIAINPDTEIEVLDEYLSRLDGILVMTVYPGFAGQKIVDSSFDKVFRLREHLKDLNLDIDIVVDGNITIENASKLYRSGANIFVAGTSSLFNKNEQPVKEIIEAKRKAIGW